MPGEGDTETLSVKAGQYSGFLASLWLGMRLPEPYQVNVSHIAVACFSQALLQPPQLQKAPNQTKPWLTNVSRARHLKDQLQSDDPSIMRQTFTESQIPIIGNHWAYKTHCYTKINWICMDMICWPSLPMSHGSVPWPGAPISQAVSQLQLHGSPASQPW